MSFDHSFLRATWAPGQRWETMVVEKVEDPQWVPVNGEPLWDDRQDYRLAPVQAEAVSEIERIAKWFDARPSMEMFGPTIAHAIRELAAGRTPT